MQYVKEEPPGWQDRKNNAANMAADFIISTMSEKESKPKDPYAISDSDDSDASFNEYNAETIKKFANVLKSNFIVDSSFHDLSISMFCFCPCSTKLHKWREIFDVTGLRDSDQCDSCSKTMPMKPQGIMDHLKTVGKNRKAVLHRLVYQYLRVLWYDSGGNRLCHEALYKPGDKNHKKGVRAGIK